VADRGGVVSDDERDEPPWPELDDGIRETVRALWLAGFDPTDSGDGARRGIKADWGDEALDVPHVFMCCEPCDLLTDARRLLALVESWGDHFAGPFAGPTVQACYLPGDDVAVLELYGALR
jgi:hypothetical protein